MIIYDVCIAGIRCTRLRIVHSATRRTGEAAVSAPRAQRQAVTSRPVSDEDGDQSTSGPGLPNDVVGADETRLAEFRGTTEDDLGRDARADGTKTPRVG